MNVSKLLDNTSFPSLNSTGFKRGKEEEEECANCEFEVLHKLSFLIIVLMLRLINIVAHSFGSHLLISLYKMGRSKSPQALLIIHLSIVELLRNIISTPIQVLDHPKVHTEEIWHVQFFLVNISSTTFDLMFYLSMYYITIDRLLAVRLNIKYQVTCTIRRIKYLLAGSWFIAIAIGLCLNVLFVTMDAELFIPPTNLYANLCFSVGFLLLSIVTYAILFHSLRNSLATKGREEAENGGKSLTMWDQFRQSKFIVSVLLIASFLLMVIIPDIGYLLGSVHINFEYPRDPVLVYFLGILGALSDLVDALIYIFLQPKVRKLFLEKLCCIKKGTTAKFSTALTVVYDTRGSSIDLTASVITLDK